MYTKSSTQKYTGPAPRNTQDLHREIHRTGGQSARGLCPPFTLARGHTLCHTLAFLDIVIIELHIILAMIAIKNLLWDNLSILSRAAE